MRLKRDFQSAFGGPHEKGSRTTAHNISGGAPQVLHHVGQGPAIGNESPYMTEAVPIEFTGVAGQLWGTVEMTPRTW